MASSEAACELEEGEISDDAEELGDYDARTAREPRPPAKPFGIVVDSSHHSHKPRHRPKNSSPPPPRYYKKPLCTFNPPNGGHYDRNGSSHSWPSPNGVVRPALRSAVMCRGPPTTGRGGPPSSLQSYVVRDNRTSGSDDRNGRRTTSHLDHYSWFRRSVSGGGGSTREPEKSSSHGRFPPPPPTSQRSRPERGSSPKAPHSSSTRKNQSQPKFLQNSVNNEPSYEDLLAQYRSIQHQLEDLNKHSFEEHKSTPSSSHEKSSSKKNDAKKKSHKPKCRKARKSLSEDKPRQACAEEVKEQVPPPQVSPITVICTGNIESRPSPPVVEETSTTSPPPVLPQPSDAGVEDDDDDDIDLVELRRRALESIKSAKAPVVQQEKPTEDTESASVLPLEELPSDLLEAERPIQEVQEKQKLKKGQRNPWFDRELAQQMRRKDRAYHKWKRHPCYDNWEAFKALKREYTRMLKRKRTAYVQETSQAKAAEVAAAVAPAASDAEVAAHVGATVVTDVVSDGVESSCDSVLPTLDSIPLPNPQSEDNYEPVEMEVDSDDGTQPPTLEVAGGSDDEDEEALRAQLLQAMLQKRRKPRTSSESQQQQQQLHQHQHQQQLAQQQQQQQQRANHRTPLSPLDNASAPGGQLPEATGARLPKVVQPGAFTTPKTRHHVPKGAEPSFVDVRKTEPLVINLAVDDTTSEEDEEESEVEEEPERAIENSFSLGLDRLLKEARQKSQVPAPPTAVPATAPLGSTPVSVMKLSQAQQLEYRRLKAEIARRELRSVVGAASESQQQQLLRARRLKQQASAKRSLEALENTLHTERKALLLEGKRMNTLRAEVLTKKSAVRGTQVRIQRLREQLATLERLVAGHATGIRKANVQLQSLQTAVDKRKGHIAELENQCRIHGKILYGAKYQLPETAEAGASGSPGAAKRKISISSLQQVQKRARITGPDSADGAATAQTRRTDAAFLAEKIRLQKLEAEMRLRLEELKQGSLGVPSAPTPPPTQPSAAMVTPETVTTATPASPSAGAASTASKAVSRKVVVTAGGKDVAAVPAKAADVTGGVTASAPTVTVTITVGNDVPVTGEPPSEEPPPSEASEDSPALGSRHRAAMEAMFLDHCTKQLRARCSEVALLPSSEFLLPQKDETARLELCLLRHRRSDDATAAASLRGSGQRAVDVSVPYVSPLLHLRGYRLHPNFLKQEGQSLDSGTYAHRMHSRIHLCRYELGGACYDARCNRQHEKDYKCTPDEVLMDLALYSPTLLKISPSDSPQQWRQKAEIYVANMKRKHQGLDTEALCRLVVTDVNRSLNKAAPYYTAMQKRGWFPQQSQNSSRALKALEALEKPAPLTTEKDWQSLLQQQRVETDDPELLDLDPEVRYFGSAHLGTTALEALVSEQPHNVGLWLRLAYRHLHGRQKDGNEDDEEGGEKGADNPEARLDQALNVFSQALENNRGSPEVWRHYLGWYAAHPQCQDLDYLCRKALDYCSHNAVWWKCAVLVDSLSSKCQLCQQQLYNLTQGVSGGRQPDSRCILEVVLYWARLCATAGNMPLAFLILKTSCKSAIEFEYFVDAQEGEELLDATTRDILQCANMLLSPDDLCFLRLCYLHFVEFRTLPGGLFCAERGSVGRLCSTDCFEIPWGQRQTLTQSLDSLVCAFHEGMEELGGPDKCVPLFASHLDLLASHSELADAVLLCNTTLEDNPSWSDGWLQLVALYVKSGDFEEACSALQRGLSQLPTDARLVFKAASGKFGMSEIVLRQLLDNFVDHHFHVDDDGPLGGRRETAESVISFPKLVNENDSHAIYARLNFIELVKLSGASSSDVSELYETLVTAATTTFEVQLAWWWYLNYRLDGVIQRESGSAAALSSLVERCLESTPSRRPLPTEPRKTWDDHGFANHVLDRLTAHMTSPRDAADLLRSYLGGDKAKPNTALVQRVVELYLEADDRDTAETVLRAALVPGLLSQRLWQLGIQLAITDGDSYEVHRLFEAAVLSMPYHADLWCHFLIYELTQGHEEHARKVVESASKYQVPGTQEILDSFLAKELTEEEALNRLGVFLLPP